jgi:hypothetical protein
MCGFIVAEEKMKAQKIEFTVKDVISPIEGAYNRVVAKGCIAGRGGVSLLSKKNGKLFFRPRADQVEIFPVIILSERVIAGEKIVLKKV